jgi:Secretion system C-terminal sorting domain
MKCSILLMAGIFFLPVAPAAQLINNSATIVVTPGTNLVLDNLTLQNNGVFNQTAGTVSFTGNTNTFITGSIVPSFYTIVLNKTGAGIQLQSAIVIHNDLQFTNGLFDLNNHIIALDPNAVLSGETEESHIFGPSGGYVQITKLLDVPVAENPGNLGAVITSSQHMGIVTIRRGQQSQTNGVGTGNSVLRYYDINPATNTSLNATLRFNYLKAELNGLDENRLVVWKSDDNVKWTDLGRTTNNIAGRYVELSGISDFARFTLSTPDNALPLLWSSFSTQCLQGKVRINWKTEQEQHTASFIIRRSTDGRNWTVIATLPAAGNSTSARSYSYIDQQPVPGADYYQILEQDMDGRQNISPVLRNNCGVGEGLKVFPNPVTNSCWVNIQSATVSTVTMRLYDNMGRLLQERRSGIQNGNNLLELRLDGVARGIYSLVISWTNGGTKTVKVEKN